MESVLAIMDGDKTTPKPRQEQPKTGLTNITEDTAEDVENGYSDTSSIRSGESLSEPDEALNKEQRSIKGKRLNSEDSFMAINHYDTKLQRTSTHLKSSSEDDRSLSLDAAREDVLRKSVQKVANRSSEMSTSMKEKRERKLEEIVSKFHGDTDTLKRTQQPAY